MGVGFRNDASFLQTGLAMTTAGSPQTWPIPAAGLLAPTCSAGRIRLKVYNGAGTTPTVTDIIVQAKDGTNTILLGGGFLHPNVGVLISATQWLEFEFEFVIDVATTAGAGGGSIGQLLASVGGASTLSVITTMTGAGGTASLDIDLVPLI